MGGSAYMRVGITSQGCLESHSGMNEEDQRQVSVRHPQGG
jgi:hypothetical protein